MIVGPQALPRAPEPHTQRPGTTRPDQAGPDQQEDSMSTAQPAQVPGQRTMPAQHRTEITFDKYLMDIANIALAAGVDKEAAESLAEALGLVADALRDMATDLVGDHNVSTQVTDQVVGLADAAAAMKAQAKRCAAECETAGEAATLAAVAVARVYQADIDAMDEAGLAQASSAAHHD